MAYEVTATRRRPQRFEDLAGQEFVAQTFKNSIESGKIAHAYLFSGPRGCGKTSTARILAKALNCKNGPTSTPCGECEACREITAGSALDVIEIDGASNNGVDAARQIKDEVLFPPNTYRYKVYIIDEVHMLTNAAFNALLKTIEEPPHYAVFIFATTELQKVPVTIKSRCQQFNFRLVPIEKVKEQLAQAASEVGIKADDEALYWIARESTGSMRDSYTLFDQVAAFSDGEITYEKIRDKLGLVGVDRLNELFELCITGKSEQVLLKLDEYLQSGVTIEQFISNCTDYIRSLLLIKNGILREALLGQSPDRYSKAVLEAWNSIKLERALSIFLQLYRDIRYSLSPRYELELALSRLCWLTEYVSSVEVKKAVDAVKPLLQEAAYPRKLYVEENTSVNETQASAPSPNGMPVFSALKNQSERSFNQGGAEPPLNKSAVALPAYDGNAEDYSDDGYIEDSLAETYSDSSDSYNDFSNKESLESKMNYYESMDAESDKRTEKKKDSFIESFQSSGPLDVSNSESVKKAVIADLSFTDAMLASALLQTVNWTISSDSVSAQTYQKFESMTLQSGSSKISESLSKILSRPVRFNISLVEKKSDVVEVKIPDIVAAIRDEFRGTVMGF